MESIVFRSWWLATLRGVLGILFAILAIGWPGLTLLSLVGLFAVYAILAGIASVVFGAFVFARPGAGALALVWLVSPYAVVTGALLLALGVRLRAYGGGRNRLAWTSIV